MSGLKRTPMPYLKPLPFPVPSARASGVLFRDGRWKLENVGFNTFDISQLVKGKWFRVAANVEDLDKAYRIYNTNVDGDHPIRGTIHPVY